MAPSIETHARDLIYLHIEAERLRQEQKWGEQHHDFGTGSETMKVIAAQVRQECEDAFRAGVGTWRHILSEEFWEALAEDDPGKLRTELTHLIAVAVAMIEDIESR